MSINPYEASEAELEAFALQWAVANVPSVYAHTKQASLPDQEAMRLAMGWDWGDVNFGWYAYGPTGTGKTRTLVLRLKRDCLYEENVRYIRGKALGDEIVERTRPGGKGEFRKWFDALMEAPVIGIDEFDKVTWSKRVSAEVFELIEVRLSNQLTTFIVAQCSIDRLVEKAKDKAPEEITGIARRIREMLVPIRFDKP